MATAPGIAQLTGGLVGWAPGVWGASVRTAMGPGSTMDATVAFEWLENPRGRRSALATIHKAVRAGWMNGPEMAERRVALIDALVRLIEDPTVSPREHLRLFRIFATMAGAPPFSRTLR